MAVEVEIDVALLKSEIKKTYSSVSAEPERVFIFPTGRALAEDLVQPTRTNSCRRVHLTLTQLFVRVPR